MNLLEEVRYFSAVTFDDNTYNFAVTPEGNIYCCEFDLAEPAKIIEFKPNFILRNKYGRPFYSLDDYARERKFDKSLIREWIIDEDLFELLINDRKILYSAQMAVLYGFDPKYAFDANDQKRAFKYSRHNEAKRARILEPMKSGKFN